MPRGGPALRRQADFRRGRPESHDPARVLQNGAVSLATNRSAFTAATCRDIAAGGWHSSVGMGQGQKAHQASQAA